MFTNRGMLHIERIKVMKINFKCYRGMEKGGGSWLLLQVSPRTTHGLGTAPVVGARPTLLTANTDGKGNILLYSRLQRWSFFCNDGMGCFFFQGTIAIDGFSMVLPALVHHHWMFFTYQPLTSMVFRWFSQIQVRWSAMVSTLKET